MPYAVMPVIELEGCRAMRAGHCHWPGSAEQGLALAADRGISLPVQHSSSVPSGSLSVCPSPAGALDPRPARKFHSLLGGGHTELLRPPRRWAALRATGRAPMAVAIGLDNRPSVAALGQAGP